MKKIVVNGYFRSSTSAIWDILQKTNDDFLVFYEPCHPQLIKNISEDAGNDLHAKKLWENYKDISFKLSPFVCIRPNCPYTVLGFDGILSVLEEEAFSQNKNIIIQTNRMHLNLSYFYEKGYDVFHVIRSPDKVFRSMQSVFHRYNRKSDFVTRWALRFGIKDFWELELQRKVLLSVDSNFNLSKRRFYLNLNLFERVFLVWVMFNYYAMKTIDNIIKNSEFTRSVSANSDEINARFLEASSDGHFLWNPDLFNEERFFLEYDLMTTANALGVSDKVKEIFKENSN